VALLGKLEVFSDMHQFTSYHFYHTNYTPTFTEKLNFKKEKYMCFASNKATDY